MPLGAVLMHRYKPANPSILVTTGVASDALRSFVPGFFMNGTAR
jgi:hypothetical protein